MTAKELCTWCEKTVTPRCSACHQAPFCSTDCQKECWRIHKLICGAEPDVFRQAPLSSSEMTALDGLRGRRYGGPDGVQFDKYIMSVCWREPSLQTWPGIRALLVAPVTSPPVPVEEGVRETIICYSRAHLSLHAYYPPEMSNERVWHFALSAVLTCVTELMPH